MLKCWIQKFKNSTISLYAWIFEEKMEIPRSAEISKELSWNVALLKWNISKFQQRSSKRLYQFPADSKEPRASQMQHPCPKAPKARSPDSLNRLYPLAHLGFPWHITHRRQGARRARCLRRFALRSRQFHLRAFEALGGVARFSRRNDDVLEGSGDLVTRQWVEL